jgi:hypothetical protein
MQHVVAIKTSRDQSFNGGANLWRVIHRDLGFKDGVNYCVTLALIFIETFEVVFVRCS